MKPFTHKEGSNWTKWDLHVHGPSDTLEKHYPGASIDEQWEHFITEVSNCDLNVIGLTNYFSIEGYQKVLDLQKDGKIPTEINFLPNLELRLTNVNKDQEHINVHVIFAGSDKVKPESIQNFLNKLPIFNTDDSKELCCNSTDLENFGYDKATIELSILKSQLEKNFDQGKDYLLAFCCTGYGSIRLDEGQQEGQGRTGSVNQEFDRNCDFLFGNEKNTAYYISERYEGSESKPVIKGSDYHGQGSLGGSYTWIKSNPNFEGLRQIKFEPEGRVSITTEQPDKKRDYRVIKSCRFIDNTGNSLFPSEEIVFNSNLNTLIGGKSTGKSLLLYSIARTVDTKEVQKRMETIGREFPIYDFEDDSNFDFEVTWKDEEKQLLNLGESNKVNRNIIYIPQKFLNNLSESNNKSKKTLSEFILGVILQDSEAEKMYAKHEEEVRSAAHDINTNLEKFLTIAASANSDKEQLKDLGDEVGLVKSLDQVKSEIEELKKDSGLIDSEMKTYENLIEERSSQQKIFNSVEFDLKKIKDLKFNITNVGEQASEHFVACENNISTQKIKDEISSIRESFQEQYLKSGLQIEKLVQGSQALLNELKDKLTETEAKISPFSAKIKAKDLIVEKENLKSQEESKLDKLKLIKSNLLSIEKHKEKVELQIKLNYDRIFASYKKIQTEFKQFENELQDISLDINIRHETEGFISNCLDHYLNKTDYKKNFDGKVFTFTQSTHGKDVSNILSSVLSGETRLKQNRTLRDSISSILSDRFSLEFQITYKLDSFDKMSPGKRGLILLRLLIDLSEKDWPILIDQPEDDLDNRSVYKELVHFIRSKKSKRQIIIVTHNPNLVVGADSELTVVANQDGQDPGKVNKKYRFEYVTGGLEDTFKAPQKQGALNQMGIREHVCDILEGGEEAFLKREYKYNFDK